MAPVTLYAEFFGLTERPFTLLPDPDFLFWSAQHRRAYSILEYGILACAPVTLLTGEIGAGKTTLVQALLADLGEGVTAGLISNAQGGREELLHWVLGAFGLAAPAGESHVTLFHRLQDFLVAEYAAGRRVVLIFDEAQNLPDAALEQIRMITNINAGKDELVQLILVGQPELRDTVRRPEMRQLAQRIVASFHLGALTAEATAAYIGHRLRRAGGTGQEFTAEAMAAVHAATGGVPRLVNQICDFALLYAWSADQARVEADTVATVLDEGVFFGAATLPQPAAARPAEPATADVVTLARGAAR
jgi:type II secretory pathway predicted ATPase ExeA